MERERGGEREEREREGEREIEGERERGRVGGKDRERESWGREWRAASYRENVRNLLCV